jgi:hypothetical protein
MMKKTIITLCLGLLIAFKASAFDNTINGDLKEAGYVTGLNRATGTHPTQSTKRMSASTFNEEESWLTELSVYGLIILVYSLYCYKTSQ